MSIVIETMCDADLMTKATPELRRALKNVTLEQVEELFNLKTGQP